MDEQEKHVFRIHEGADDYYYVDTSWQSAHEEHRRLMALRLDPAGQPSEVEGLPDDAWLRIYSFSDYPPTSARPMASANRLCGHWAGRSEIGLLCSTAYPDERA